MKWIKQLFCTHHWEVLNSSTSYLYDAVRKKNIGIVINSVCTKCTAKKSKGFTVLAHNGHELQVRQSH